MESQELEHEQMTECITFRLTPSELALVKRAADAYRMEAGRLVRRLVSKRLSELKDDIERRLATVEKVLL